MFFIMSLCVDHITIIILDSRFVKRFTNLVINPYLRIILSVMGLSHVLHLDQAVIILISIDY
ncbi:hypothetical protein BH23THE1_BH23THE1_16930 [soil metagenome]